MAFWCRSVSPQALLECRLCRAPTSPRTWPVLVLRKIEQQAPGWEVQPEKHQCRCQVPRSYVSVPTQAVPAFRERGLRLQAHPSLWPLTTAPPWRPRLGEEAAGLGGGRHRPAGGAHEAGSCHAPPALASSSSKAASLLSAQ